MESLIDALMESLKIGSRSACCQYAGACVCCGRVPVKIVTLAHCGGGKAMRDLIDGVYIFAIETPEIGDAGDQAWLMLALS